MRVDQSRQHELVAQVDDPSAGVASGVREAIADRLDLAVADQDRRCATLRLPGAVEQAPGVDHRQGIHVGLRGDAGSRSRGLATSS